MFRCLASVSIHAPVWGATKGNGRRKRDPGGFNPRSRMGSDEATRTHWDDRNCFNPRSRMGSDRPGRGWSGLLYVSIHAPVWGATQSRHSLRCLLLVSIHAPVWGATKYRFFIVFIILFQSTLPYGERPSRQELRRRKWEFQSTLPYGERR